jgi:hypothetical protein
VVECLGRQKLQQLLQHGRIAKRGGTKDFSDLPLTLFLRGKNRFAGRPNVKICQSCSSSGNPLLNPCLGTNWKPREGSLVHPCRTLSLRTRPFIGVPGSQQRFYDRYLEKGNHLQDDEAAGLSFPFILQAATQVKP